MSTVLWWFLFLFPQHRKVTNVGEGATRSQPHFQGDTIQKHKGLIQQKELQNVGKRKEISYSDSQLHMFFNNSKNSQDSSLLKSTKQHMRL